MGDLREVLGAWQAEGLEGSLGVALSNAVLSCKPTNHTTECLPPAAHTGIGSPPPSHSPKSQGRPLSRGGVLTRAQPVSPDKEKPPSLRYLAPHTGFELGIRARLQILVIYIDDLATLSGPLPHSPP